MNLEEQIHSDISHTLIRYDFQILSFDFDLCFLCSTEALCFDKVNMFLPGYLYIKCNILKKKTHGHLNTVFI